MHVAPAAITRSILLALAASSSMAAVQGLARTVPGSSTTGPPEGTMQRVVQQYDGDRASLLTTYSDNASPTDRERMRRFYLEEQASLTAVPFEALMAEDKLDYLLLVNQLKAQLHALTIVTRQQEEIAPLLPFAGLIIAFDEQRRRMERPGAEQSAGELTHLVVAIHQAQSALSEANVSRPKASVANRAVQSAKELDQRLGAWYTFSNGYDPEFTWWAGLPYKAAHEALEQYEVFLKEKLAGISAGDTTAIVGDPVGRDALMAELDDERIPYTPEQLIAIAETEMDWCKREMLRASSEMGYGDDWHKALEHVKTMHVAPGEQPQLIRKLVLEGIDFVKKEDLVTVPPLAEETWRMEMMSPERQLVNPFFTGGDVISVSYPTDTMTYAQREMSMRGNNIPFSRDTAFHEMIPGHYLQQYMAARYRTYREPFSTPFWYEGNAFYWEMLLWDKGFTATPEERVGALFWRMHRSARVIFTMRFHLGEWTPQQCIDFLVQEVGHEHDNAAAEVRRSFDGSVGPLYQSAYLMGALEFRALHQELVGSGKMADRAFHDAVLQQNAMPVDLLRAYLEHLPLTRDYKPTWKFYGQNPVHP